MNLKHLAQGTLFSAISLIPFATLAAENQITCPPVELVRKAVLDTVTMMYPSTSYRFIVWSSDMVVKDSDYSWSVTTFVTANDMTVAQILGQNAVRTIDKQFTPEAASVGEYLYMCDYNSPGTLAGVKAIAYKSELRRVNMHQFLNSLYQLPPTSK